MAYMVHAPYRMCSMGRYVKEFPGYVSAIVTNCMVFTPDDLSKGTPRAYYHSQNCVWDTGAETTVLCPELAEALGLKEMGRGQVGGIGGDHEGWITEVHLGLPSGETFENLLVLVDELPDYDMLIGMDVMREMDVAITNAKGHTIFTFERPSKRSLDFTQE